MNQQLENLMYESGLTAQGCWDSMDDYDHAAIEKLVELVVQESIDVIVRHDYHGQWLGEKIKQHFGIDQ
jgi:hypothetical protein